MIERIKEKKNRGLIRQDKKITQNMLVEEHWKYWLEIDNKDALKKLFNHPLLEDADFKTVNSIISDQK